MPVRQILKKRDVIVKAEKFTSNMSLCDRFFPFGCCGNLITEMVFSHLAIKG